MFCGDQLRVSIINDFIDYFVNEHKVFPYRLFVEDAAIVAKNFHHSVNYVEDDRWGHVVLRCRYKVNAKFLREKVIDAVYVLYIWGKIEEKVGSVFVCLGNKMIRNFAP